MRSVGVASSGTYQVLRELGSRAQPTLAAVRRPDADAPAIPSEVLVLTRFVRSGRAQAKGPCVVDEAAFATLSREARVAARTFHPNLARVRYVDVDGDELSIATELIDGATLRDLLALAPIPLDIQLRILLDVLVGLAALHAMRDADGPLGAIHGAVAPDNVVVGKDGVARLVSLFRARPVRAAAEAIGHASPEALDFDGAREPPSDLWSAGVMLWEAIVGHRLFGDEGDPARLLSLLREQEVPRPCADGAPDRVRGAAEVALRALAFDPGLRWRSASEMASELRTAAGRAIAPGSAVAQHVADIAGESIRARRASLESPPPKRTSSGVRRSFELDGGSKVTLLPTEEEDAVALDAGVRIADSSLMAPARRDVAPSAPSIGGRRRPAIRRRAERGRSVESERQAASAPREDAPTPLPPGVRVERAEREPSAPAAVEAPPELAAALVIAAPSADDAPSAIRARTGRSRAVVIAVAIAIVALVAAGAVAARKIATSAETRPTTVPTAIAEPPPARDPVVVPKAR